MPECFVSRKYYITEKPPIKSSGASQNRGVAVYQGLAIQNYRRPFLCCSYAPEPLPRWAETTHLWKRARKDIQKYWLMISSTISEPYIMIQSAGSIGHNTPQGLYRDWD